MDNFKESTFSKEIIEYRCPKFNEIADMGLYMEQLIETLNSHLAVFISPSEEKIMTSTMVNNYVKQKIIPAPIRKKYSKSQLLYLYVIGILKQIMNIADIGNFLEMQKNIYPIEMAYNFFCIELEKALHATFVTRDFSLPSSATMTTDMSEFTRSVLLAFTNKIYLKKYIAFRNELSV